jgi:hypothetical protein
MKRFSDTAKLIAIKLIHTVIWCVFVAAILYVCYAGIFDQVNPLVWWCVGLVLIEGVVVAANQWKCPLTNYARKYAETHTIGFDIYLPEWFKKHNIPFFTVLFLIGLGLVIWRAV